MIAKYRNRAARDICAGLALGGASGVLAFQKVWPLLMDLPIFMIGLGLYARGCLYLARAKGYSSAIVVTIIVGILPTAVALLVLPDKYRYDRRRTQRSRSWDNTVVPLMLPSREALATNGVEASEETGSDIPDLEIQPNEAPPEVIRLPRAA